MKKTLKLIGLTVLTLIVLSPLVLAGSGHVHRGHRPSTPFVAPAGFNRTLPIVHKPPFHAPTTGFKKSFPIAHKPILNHPHVPGFKPLHPIHPKAGFHGAFPGKVTTASLAPKGISFSHGIYYPGHLHRHWTRRSWSPTWGSWFWFCPHAKTWFYHHKTNAAYYPINYLRFAPPTAMATNANAVPPGGEAVPLASPEEIPAVPQR